MISDTTGAKIAKNLLTKLTNNQILGGKRLIRGYREVMIETKKQNEEKEEADKKKQTIKSENEPKEDNLHTPPPNDPKKREELDKENMIKQEAEDYENEESEGDLRAIDHLVFVIHGYIKKGCTCSIN